MPLPKTNIGESTGKNRRSRVMAVVDTSNQYGGKKA